MTGMDLLTSRALGALYGVALGDAMGMPSEGMPRALVAARLGPISGFLPGTERMSGTGTLPAGHVTDDTRQTLLLAEAVLEGEGLVDPDAIGRRLVDWADGLGDTAADLVGPSSARAIESLRAGGSAWRTGVRGETNGAAMRITPIALIAPSDDLEALVDRVEVASLVAHHTDVAVSAAALVAGAVSAALDAPEAPSGRADEADRRLDRVIETALEAARLGAERGARVAAASVVARAQAAVQFSRARTTDDAYLQRVYDVIGSGVAANESVPAALGIAVRAQGDPMRAATLAANLGGDTDTVGAIAAAICGAFSGVEAIPADIRRTLDEVNALELAPLVERLLALRPRRRADAERALTPSA